MNSSSTNSTNNSLELTTQVYDALEYGNSQGWGEDPSTSDAELQLSDEEDIFYDVQEYPNSQGSVIDKRSPLSDEEYTNQINSSESTVVHGGESTSLKIIRRANLGLLIGGMIGVSAWFCNVVRGRDDGESSNVVEENCNRGYIRAAISSYFRRVS